MGRTHSCAVLSGGSVKCWGDKTFNQLGDGTELMKAPTTVSGISNASEIGVGVNHSCALLDNGSVKCWGDVQAVGIDTNNNQLTPVTVENITTASQISSSYYHSCSRYF